MPPSYRNGRPHRHPAPPMTSRRHFLATAPAAALGAGVILGRSPVVSAQSQVGYQSYFLTNLTGVDLVPGDVVALHTTIGQAVELADQWFERRQYVVAISATPRNAVGEFGRGYVYVKDVSVLPVAGAYFRKSDRNALSGVGARAVQVMTDAASYGFMSWRVAPAVFTLGYFVGTRGPTGLTLAYFHGDTSVNAEDTYNDVILRDEFTTYDDLIGAVRPSTAQDPAWLGIGQVVYSSERWLITGQSPSTDQGTNGRITVASDGTTAGRMYLAKNGSGAFGNIFRPDTDNMVLRCILMQKGTTAAVVRRFGLADATLTAEVANGIYFQWTHNANVFCRVRKAGVTNLNQDSGFSLSTGPYSLSGWEIRIGPLNIDFFAIISAAELKIGSVDRASLGPVVALGPAFGVSVTTPAGNGFIIDRVDALGQRVTL